MRTFWKKTAAGQDDSIDDTAEIREDISPYTAEVLRILTNQLICVSLFISLESIFRENYLQILFLCAIPVLYLLFEEWLADLHLSLVPFFGIHILIAAACAGMAFAGVGIADWLTLAFIVLIMIFAISARLRQVRFFHPKWPLFLWGFSLFIAGYALGMPDIVMTAQVTIVLTAILCLIWYNLTSVRYFLSATHTKATIPYEQIRLNNRVVLFSSLGILAAVLAPILLLVTGEPIFLTLFRLVRAALLAFLRFLGSFFQGEEEEIIQETVVSETNDSQDAVFGIEETSNPLLEAIWDAMAIVMTVCLVILIVWFVIHSIRQFRKRFNSARRIDGDRVEFLEPEEENETMPEEEGRTRFFDRSARARIRRAYGKLIRNGSGADSIRESHTPLELEETSLGRKRPGFLKKKGDGEQDALDTLHELYEKARYSKEDCTKEEAARMKEQLRKL